MNEEESLRVAVLVGEELSDWQYRALQRAHDDLDIEYTLVLKTPIDSVGLSRKGLISRWRKIWRDQGYWGLITLERSLRTWIMGENQFDRQTRTIDPETVDVLSDAEVITIEPIRYGAWNEFPSRVVARISHADVAIRFGFGLIRGDVLNAPPMGIVSFHPADVEKYRGQGTEQIFLNGDNVGMTTLQRLNETIDGGEIVARGRVDVSDAATFDEVLAQLRERQVSLLSEGLHRLQNSDFQPTPPAELGDYYTHHDTLPYVSQFLIQNQIGRINRLVRKLRE